MFILALCLGAQITSRLIEDADEFTHEEQEQIKALLNDDARERDQMLAMLTDVSRRLSQGHGAPVRRAAVRGVRARPDRGPVTTHTRRRGPRGTDRKADTMIDGGAMAQAVLYAIEYVALGVILLGFGFLALDAITPGKLGALIMHDRSVNAAIVTAAGFIGLSAVIFTAIWTNSEGGVLSALVWTAVFGLLGIVLQLVAFLLLDLVTPGQAARGGHRDPLPPGEPDRGVGADRGLRHRHRLHHVSRRAPG